MLHLAIIMDGNGRWAQARGWRRWRGHAAGVDRVRTVVRAAPGLGVGTLTLYAFSSDNWRRPPVEVERLFGLLLRYCRLEQAELIRQGVRVSVIGRRDRLPPAVRVALEDLETGTAGGRRLHLRLAIDYSARFAIAAASRRVVNELLADGSPPDHLDPERIEAAIAPGVPPVDLLVRTAGEQRLSDFLLWELAYAELYFTDCPWPEFGVGDLRAAIAEFHRRERRYGGLDAVPGSRSDRLAG